MSDRWHLVPVASPCIYRARWSIRNVIYHAGVPGADEETFEFKLRSVSRIHESFGSLPHRRRIARFSQTSFLNSALTSESEIFPSESKRICTVLKNVVRRSSANDGIRDAFIRRQTSLHSLEELRILDLKPAMGSETLRTGSQWISVISKNFE